MKPKSIYPLIFFGASLFFAATTCVGQSLEAFNAQIRKSLTERDSFYLKYRKGGGSYYDSLSAVSASLSNYFKQTLPKLLSSVSSPQFTGLFDTIRSSESIYAIRKLWVASAPDGKMRIWTWDTETGGSMPAMQNIVAYQTNEGTRITDLEEDLGWGPKDRGGNHWFDTIFTIQFNNRTIYLPRASWKGDGRNSGLTLFAFAIEGDKLNTELDLFPGPYEDKPWDYEITAVCEDCEIPKLKIKSNVLYVQHIGQNKNGKDILTSKWDIYKFDGQHFLFKGTEK
jgi:hypothetical protein